MNCVIEVRKLLSIGWERLMWCRIKGPRQYEDGYVLIEHRPLFCAHIWRDAP